MIDDEEKEEENISSMVLRKGPVKFTRAAMTRRR